MKSCVFKFSISLAFILFFSFAIPCYGFYIQDTTKTDSADYTNVDVIVETEWAGKDKNIDVTVYVKKENNQPSVIVMTKNHHTHCEVAIIPGVIIRIYDHKTGKLLKTYKR